jgi:hypothetical protein
MNVDLAAQLIDRLNEPQPPPSLMATVMARVTQEAEARTPVATGAPAARVRDGVLAAGLVAGLVAAGGVTIWHWLPVGGPLSQLSPRVLGSPAGLIGLGDPAALPFMLGLALYLFVLFSPLRARRGT